MAQGNLFKGKSRGSIGDVTFSTQAGKQISRVRNRHPRNPRTNTQMFQRAIWATIVQAYSYGKDFFGTAFESAQTKRQNQTAFMSVNMNYLRELLTDEIDNETPIDEQRGRVVHPNSYTPVPIDGLTASQGTLEDNIFTVTPATAENVMSISMPAPANDTETIAEYAERIGLTSDTTYTMLAHIVDTSISILYPQQIATPYAINYQSYFATARLTYTDANGSKTIASATLGDIFVIAYTGQLFPHSMQYIAFGNGTWSITTLLRKANLIGTFAISAYNKATQQTTTSTMQWISRYNAYGIASKYTLDVWGKAEQKQIEEYIPQEPLPFDTEIEYIRFTGQQWIDLGIKGNSDTKVELEFSPTDAINGCVIFGTRQSAIINNISCLIGKGDLQINVDFYNYQTSRALYKPVINNTWYKIAISSTKREISSEGNILDENTTIITNIFNTIANLAIGYSNPAMDFGNNTNNFVGKFRKLIIWEGDIEIMNLIPVSKNNNGYMYDTISKQLFGNSGNGIILTD